MGNHSDRIRNRLVRDNSVSRRRVLGVYTENKEQDTVSEEERRKQFDLLWVDEGVVD